MRKAHASHIVIYYDAGDRTFTHPAEWRENLFSKHANRAQS